MVNLHVSQSGIQGVSWASCTVSGCKEGGQVKGIAIPMHFEQKNKISMRCAKYDSSLRRRRPSTRLEELKKMGLLFSMRKAWRRVGDVPEHEELKEKSPLLPQSS